MTPRAVVAGSSPRALTLALALADRGHEVSLIVDDLHDRARTADLLMRAGRPGAIALQVDVKAAQGAALVIETEGRVPVLSALAHPGALAVGIGTGLPPGPGRAVIAIAAPPPDLGVIEVLPGSDPRILDLARDLGAVPVTVPAFLAPRLVAAIEDAVEALILEGSTPWEVDAAAEAMGFAPGPCAAQDLRGLDLTHGRHRREGHALPVLDRMVAEGRLGRKGGVGWYRYPGGGGRVIDPLIEDLAREEARFAGIAPRPIPDTEIRHRLRAALVGAARASAADPATLALVAAAALGLPAAQSRWLDPAAPG